MTAAGGARNGLRIGVPAGRAPGLAAWPDLVQRVVVAVAPDRDPPLPERLSALASRLDAAGHRWVAAAWGDREALDYLAELLGSDATRRGGRLVTVLAGGDPRLEVLLGGERAVGHVVVLLQVESRGVEAVVEALRGGADPLEQARLPGVRLALRHRPDQPWALLAWSSAKPSPLAAAGIADSEQPVAVPRGGGAVRTGRAVLPVVLAALLGAAALALTLHNSGTPRTAAPVTVTPTPLPTPRPPPTFAADVPGPAPAARELASTAYDFSTGSGVLFGGIAQGPGAADLADTWTWTPGHWQQRRPAHSPPPRSAAAMAYDPVTGGVLLFGGVSRGRAGARLEDTWRWDGVDWTEVAARSSPPPGSVTVGMAWAAVRSRLVLVTDPGVVGAPPQTWTWDGGEWSGLPDARTPALRLMAAEPRSGGVLGVSASDVPGPASTWLWSGGVWTVASTVGLEFEPFTATMVTDPVRGEVVMTEQLFADAAGATGGTFTWDGQAWIHHGGEVPDILQTFDASQALWAVSAGHLDLVGGPLVGLTYRTAWEWDGSAWHRL